MTNPYDKLAQFKQRKISKIKSMGTQGNAPQITSMMQTDSLGELKRRNVPTSILTETAKERESNLGKYLAQQSQQNQLQLLDEQEDLANIETKRTMFDEEQKKIRDERQKAKDKMLTQLIGTGVGAVVGTIVSPGPGTLLGAQIGSGLGTAAAGAGVGTGDFMGEKTIDPEMIAMGLENTVSAVQSGAKTAKLKGVGDAYADNLDNINSMTDPAGVTNLRQNVEFLMMTGEWKKAAQYIRDFDYATYALQ